MTSAQRTEGPWTFGNEFEGDNRTPLLVIDSEGNAVCTMEGVSKRSREHAAFIVSACNNFDRVRAENEALRQALQNLLSHTHHVHTGESMERKEYNGWASYETWLAALWIDNDTCAQEAAREWTLATRERARAGEYRTEYTLASLSDDDLARHRLADELKAWVEMSDIEGGLMPDLGASLAADLLSGALSEIDWLDLARHYLDAYADEVAS